MKAVTTIDAIKYIKLLTLSLEILQITKKTLKATFYLL